MKALTDLIRDIPDFPEPGIMFKDITPLLGDHNGLQIAVGALVEHYREADVTLVAGIESRGSESRASCPTRPSARSTSSNTGPTHWNCTATRSNRAIGS